MIGISASTAGRRQTKQEMSIHEGEKIVRYARLLDLALGLMDGNKDSALRWLQEAQANAFGAQLSDRINQAAGGDLDSTGGSTFDASLKNSNTVALGTTHANMVGNAEVDNRRLNSQFAMGLPSYIESKKAQGDLKGAQAAEVLLILGTLAEKRGDTKNLNAEIDQLDPQKLGVSQESLDAAKQLPDGIKQRIITAEPADFCDGKACIVTAKVADSMVNLESMTDLAVELVGGALIKAGVDAYTTIKAGGKTLDEVANVNISAVEKTNGDMSPAVRAEGDFGKVVPNHQFTELQTTSGVIIKVTEGKTTTVLGTYVGDTRNIIEDQLILAKNPDFTVGNAGGFNVLNVPDSNKSADEFWSEVNEPFLKAAVDRGDEIYLATTPVEKNLNRVLENGEIIRSGFGKEYDFLVKYGYQYNQATGKMIKVK